jgi:uncharacterized protein
MKIMSDNPETVLSNYGIYDLKDELELLLPNTSIKFHRISDNAFSYFRKNSEGNIIEKIIPVKSNDLKIELAPIRPLNHPARRTNHIFLKFDKTIHLSANSAASIFIHCPIEVGIFLIHDSIHDSLDWITCDPLNSRFALYGAPDTGILCKYAKVSSAIDYDDSNSYLEGVMQIILENTLSSSQSISKVVFPITDNTLYYQNTKTIIDGIKITMKKRAAVNIADVNAMSLETDWSKSPTWEDKIANTHMEMGLE